MIQRQESNHWDVVIVGGGPVGSTAGSLLRKYDPDMRVLIIEKEKFPREHVGESQLPVIGKVLHEMGVWDDIEAANFPVKVGASYTWGKTKDRWNFDFFEVEKWTDQQRPGKFEGVRTQTAFQVDRYVYDDILLKHAKKMGCEVWEETLVKKIMHESNRITGFELSNGQAVTADWYIDGSGAAGLFRRTLDIKTWSPDELKNVAFWRYWQNADWATEIGIGATRVEVRSLPFGWIWFIPLGPTRTSVGLICPAEYYKQSGMTPDELYQKAIREQEDISKLMVNAEPDGDLESAKDWSYVAEKLSGPNWMIAGEAGGFADPILAAGLSMAHTSARHAAYVILESRRGTHDDDWLLEDYEFVYSRKIKNHIRFAQYWYAANSHFTDLQEHCSKIAKEAGLDLSPKKAWRWLAQGGFLEESPGTAVFGGYRASSLSIISGYFFGEERQSTAIGKNKFKLVVNGVEEGFSSTLMQGKIEKTPCLIRDGKRLPLVGAIGFVVKVLRDYDTWDQIADAINMQMQMSGMSGDEQAAHAGEVLWALDSLIAEHWVIASVDKRAGAKLGFKSTLATIRYFKDFKEKLDAESEKESKLTFKSRID